MKNLSIFPTDIAETLDAKLVSRVLAVCRNVRLTPSGYLIHKTANGKKADYWPAKDWRFFYKKSLQKLFPDAWIYTGGHHIAVHASPPSNPKATWGEPGGQAGSCLFRIIEVQKLAKLACGRYYGETEGGRCSKCTAIVLSIDRDRDANLIAAIQPAETSIQERAIENAKTI